MEKLKRYLVFGFSDFYPSGGLADVIDSFDGIDKAVECCINSAHDYNYIWDRIDGIDINIEDFLIKLKK